MFNRNFINYYQKHSDYKVTITYPPDFMIATSGLVVESSIKEDNVIIQTKAKDIPSYGLVMSREFIVKETKTGVPENYYEIPIGEPDIKRKGDNITILTIGATLYNVIKASDILKDKYNISAEVIDARSLVPFNYSLVIESVKKTSKIILSSDACSRGSYLKDMAQTITELAFDFLDAPPVIVGSRNWIISAYELENYFFPQPEWILDAIHEKIIPLKGYTVSTNFTELEQIRRSKEGV